MDPNILVAGSKMYNRDRDSLPEYEFKIGTYISFDAGRTWSDLGQLNVCPRDQAPPESWPNNTCYPEDDPNLGGTAEEDEKDPQGEQSENDPFDDRGTGDFGEEYLTSDPWIDFDDEGNVYAMVLDAPPFPNRNGWGMSFHRWETPTPEDVRSGNTWSNRIPINKYDDPVRQEEFLDDKNTFAVNNAGPDRDGRSGIMVACWGQNIDPLIKQQTVCKRSTDGGKSWPGEPAPISDLQQLVIGVHVIADERDPNTFYATWLEYAQTIAGAPGTYRFTRTTNGGQTWSPSIPVATVNDIPRTFPGQSFRNLSLPIMAVGTNPERQGEQPPLYITYPEYVAVSDPGDEDGMRSQIRFIKSVNGGSSWSPPRAVSSVGGRGDQFQQYIRITPTGQINIAYFDRRLDPADNFFIDQWLSRSDDRGNTFNDVRLSHDSWDPGINPPISSSGEFIGDYQGLVANECLAIAFFNDTHLANAPDRDPDFDAGMPRSPFQEVFAWRAPNNADFGGTLDPKCVPTGPGQPPGSGPGSGTGSGQELLPAPDRIAPKVQLRVPRLALSLRTGSLRLRWSGTDEGGAGIGSYRLQVRELRRRGATRYRVLNQATTRTRRRFQGRPGRTYQFRLTGVDRVGNVSAPVTGTTIVPLDQEVGRFDTDWRRARSRTAYFGGYRVSRTRGATFRYAYRGGTLYLVGLKSRRGGSARVTVDGKARTIDTYAPRTIDRAILLRRRLSSGRHDVTVRVLRRKRAASRGTNVRLDAIAIFRR